MTQPVRRSYRGVTPDQRDAQRRERVIDAAMRLCADRRRTDVPVAVLCRTAGVTTRQFYEIFGERDALFAAVYEHAADVSLRHTLEAIADEAIPVADRIRVMMERFFYADEHSELGQALAVLFALGATSHELHERRAAAIVNAGNVVAQLLHVPALRAGILIAAFVQLLENSWLDQPLAGTEDTIGALTELFAAHLPPSQ